MKPSYRKEKDNDYLILEAPGKPEGGEYQIRMLLVNPIYGLLSCKMRMVDGSRTFYYDITEKQPMSLVFERRLMGKEDIEKLLGGLEKAMDEAGRYLLSMEQFVLKPEYIFQDAETGAFFFCYLPFYEGSLEEDFRELAEYILKRLDHSQEEAVLWGYDIYSRSADTGDPGRKKTTGGGRTGICGTGGNWRRRRKGKQSGERTANSRTEQK